MTWQDFSPASTTRKREATEWSIHYAFDTQIADKPRVLLIGDSICNGYNGAVRNRLAGKVNVSFWASSKCVTDPDYFRELDFILDARPYDIICFNNGLHSLTTNREEWDAAYASAVAFILAKLPEVKLSLTLSTPLKDAALTAISASLNETAADIALKTNLPIIDLFSAMYDLDRDKYWTDTYHFQSEAIAIQADLIADHVLKQLGMN